MLTTFRVNIVMENTDKDKIALFLRLIADCVQKGHDSVMLHDPNHELSAYGYYLDKGERNGSLSMHKLRSMLPESQEHTELGNGNQG